MAKQSSVEEVEVDLTPMIDCVFLLIIFFMCVAQLSNDEADARVKLPSIDGGGEEIKTPDQKRTVVNIILERRDGKPNKDDDNPIFKILTVSYKYRPGEKEKPYTAMKDFIKLRRDEAGKETSGKKGWKLMIKIRSDAEAPFRFSLDVINTCQELGVEKIVFGVIPPKD